MLPESTVRYNGRASRRAVLLPLGVATFIVAAFGGASRLALAEEPASVEHLRGVENRAVVEQILREIDAHAEDLVAIGMPEDAGGRLDFGAFQDDATKPADAGAAGAAAAAGSGQSTEDLAKAAQNPVADMISVPFQNNLNFNVGSLGHDSNVLNIQPVIPFNLTDDLNLITRTIVPVIYLPALFPGDEQDFGLGDIQFTAFFSPSKPVDGWTLGVGPVIQLPTSTDERLGARKWTAGPSVVVLRMEGHWVYGALAQNVWSFAGSGDTDVNQLLIQPFVNYNLADGWYLTSAPIITANWEADSGDQWTVPLGGGVGRVFHIGHQPVNLSVSAYYNVDGPESAGDWSLRIQLQLLFPK